MGGDLRGGLRHGVEAVARETHASRVGQAVFLPPPDVGQNWGRVRVGFAEEFVIDAFLVTSEPITWVSRTIVSGRCLVQKATS